MYTEQKKKEKVYSFLITMVDCVFYWLKQINIYMIWETSDCKMQDLLMPSINSC